MPFSRNSSGKVYRTGIGGTYRVNDSDPQNEVEGFDNERFIDMEIDFDESADHGY